MGIKNCPKCGISFESIVYHGSIPRKYIRKFCSRACANSREFDEDTKEKISQTIRNLEGKLPRQRQADKWELRVCKTCKCDFEAYKISNKSYCSKQCARQLAYKNCGGYRQGSGRSKSGYYKGIYCGSTYELAWTIYRLDHGLSCKRFENTLYCPLTKKRYIPDFIDGNTIIEIKGYEQDSSVLAKNQIAKSYGYDIIVLRKEDLVEQFEWVKTKYQQCNFEVLYDDYKPKHDYVCSCCQTMFSRDKLAKTSTVFCSRHCAGKFRVTVR